MAARGKKDSWYRRDPALARRGMRGLTLEEKAIYGEIIDLTYECGGPPVDDAERMGHLCECHPRVFRRVRDQLIAKGRIRRVDGKLVDGKAIEQLTAREEERRQAVENGAIGGRKSADLRALTASSPGDQAETRRRSPELNGGVSNENRDKIQDPLNQVESEVESESDTYIESSLTDLTCSARDGPLPPIADGSVLGQINQALNNVVPVGMSLEGFADPMAIHFELASSAGPRMVFSDALRASTGYIARALAQGCDPNLDMLPAVIERTYAPGKPITTWRYFVDIWTERREARVAARRATPQAPEAREDAA